jgi:hypothetical protein
MRFGEVAVPDHEIAGNPLVKDSFFSAGILEIKDE